MESSDYSVHAPFSEKKENVMPMSPKIAELAESREELLSRLQNLKQDLQNWRITMDTQVKVYRNELSELKKSLNIEVEQLRTEFEELRSTLKQQQRDVTTSLKALGLQDVSESKTEVDEVSKIEDTTKEGDGKENDQ